MCKGVLARGGRVGLGSDSPNRSYKYGKALEHLAFIRRWTFEHEHSVIKKKVRSSGAGRKRGAGVHAPALGQARTIRTGFGYRVRARVRKAPAVRCDTGDSGRSPARRGRRNAEVSPVTRVGRPPVVQKETRGDSGEVARPSCSGKRGSVEECGWQLVRGRARPARARNSVGARRCCLFVKLAKYETWCFPSILVKPCKHCKVE